MSCFGGIPMCVRRLPKVHTLPVSRDLLLENKWLEFVHLKEGEVQSIFRVLGCLVTFSRMLYSIFSIRNVTLGIADMSEWQIQFIYEFTVD